MTERHRDTMQGAPAVPTQPAKVAGRSDPDVALRARHRAMWALGSYPTVAREVVAPLGPVLVTATEIQADDRVLDVAAGSGTVAIPAARVGAQVVAADLTPSLLSAGRRTAERAGVELTWTPADAEALPFADGSFDAVLSALGVMNAWHHQVAADELVRVCRRGGRIGLISWTPQGFIGQMFATMKPYVAPLLPGASPPPLWGNEEHVISLLGDRVVLLRCERRQLRVDRFESPADFLDFFKTHDGPTIAAHRALADEPERAAALDAELCALAPRFLEPDGSMSWEYLLLVAIRR